MPEGGGDDEPGRADKFKNAKDRPGYPWQRTKGRDLHAYLVEHEDLHDVRRSIQPPAGQSSEEAHDERPVMGSADSRLAHNSTLFPSGSMT